MANLYLILSALIFVTLLVLLAVFIYRRKQGKVREPDYFGFFVIGIILLVLGLPLIMYRGNHIFLLLGLVWFILGGAHMPSWPEKRRLKLKKGQGFVIGALWGLAIAFTYGYVLGWNLFPIGIAIGGGMAFSMGVALEGGASGKTLTAHQERLIRIGILSAVIGLVVLFVLGLVVFGWF